jgi:hypothetical protein
MSQGREQARATGLGLADGNGEPPTAQLGLAATTADHCANCGAPLAPDQRYCVNCGERRGKPRFALAEPVPEMVETKTVTTGGRGASRGPRPSYGVTLIAGIATLLLALGVGVLIGHNSAGSNNSKSASSQPLSINVNTTGSSGASTATNGSGSSGSSGSSSSSKKSHGKGKSSTGSSASKPSSAAANKANSAAQKVVGGSAPVAPATVTQGASCSSGSAGCSGGHFNGSFFGGG